MARSVLINILGNPASALAALEEVGIKAQETAKKTAGIGESAAASESKFVSLGKYAAGALVVAGIAAVDMGNKLEDARAQLVTAIKDAGGNFEQLHPQISTTDKKMESLGFTNAQTETALASMTIGLHSGQKAMDLIGLAADVARARHIDLATAATLVVKASEGQTMALRRAGIDLPVMASSTLKVKTAQEQLAKAQDALTALLKLHPDAVDAASKAHAKYEIALGKVQAAQSKVNDLSTSGGQIVDALTQRYQGQASAAADTFSGRLEVAKTRIEDLGARIGIALIPILEKLMSVISNVIGWFDRHKTAAIALAGVITTVLGAAMVAFTVNKIAQFVTGIQSAMTWLGNLAGRSRDTATKVEQDGQVMGNSAKGPGSWSEKFQGGLLVIGAGVAAFQGTMALLKSNFLGIGNLVNDAARAISNFFGGIGQVHPVTSLTTQAITFLEQVASGAVSASNITPTAAAQDLHAAGVPGYATGGYVPSTGLALLHAGETVIPAGAPAGVGALGGGGDLVMMIDGREFGRVAGPAVRTWLLQDTRRNATRIIG